MVRQARGEKQMRLISKSEDIPTSNAGGYGLELI